MAYPSEPTWLHGRTIRLLQVGSRAYGLNTEISDFDYKGIAVPPRSYFTGFAQTFEQSETHNPDYTVYDIRKFCSLSMKANPSMLELLWVDPQHVVYTTPAGEKLAAHRSLFLSRKVRHSFTGYAFSQLHRIKRHKKWLLNPPKQQPERPDFGLPTQPVMSRDTVGAIEAVIDGGSDTYSPSIIEAYTKERAYLNALREWQQYQGWLENRNPARAALEAQFGYDCKHAMHLVRLMRMGQEILETGIVHVLRPDRDELLAIRNGAWTYEQLIEYAETMDNAIKTAEETSILPWGPDVNAIDALCCEIVDSLI